jgi:hypothetical protein
MKIIKQNLVPEISEFFCDICSAPAVSFLNWDFGYGSSRDMDRADSHFCEKCGEEVLEILKNKVPNFRITEDGIL